MRLVMLAALLLAGCAPPPVPATSCTLTPTTSMVINGYTLVGTADRDLFLYLGADRVLRTEARGPEKLLVFLKRIPDPPPASLKLDGENLSTGTRRSFEVQQHSSEFGTEWGSNFFFPDSGCWQLTLTGASEGRVVVAVE